MPTRNINLTDHYDRYLTEALESGRYKNASEVVRAGLRLLESHEKQDAAKLEALRNAFQEGQDAFRRGEFDRLETDDDIDRYFDDIAEAAERSE